MDLINELGNDLAVAILIEKRHRQKIDSRGAIDLIGRIETVLKRVSRDDADARREAAPLNPANLSTSH